MPFREFMQCLTFGRRKTCPFRPCCGTFVFPELARDNKVLCDRLVQDLNERGAEYVMSHLAGDIKQALSNALKGNKDDAVRQRIAGTDSLSQSYAAKILDSTVSSDVHNFVYLIYKCSR